MLRMIFAPFIRWFSRIRNAPSAIQNGSAIYWLQKWFYSQCNGNWERTHAISIENLKPPGWSVKIELEDTHLETKQFEKITIRRSEEDWLQANKKNTLWEAHCGPHNLTEVLELFKKWAESELGANL